MLPLVLVLSLSTTVVDQTLEFDCGKLPGDQTLRWSAADQPNTSLTVVDGALKITDDGTQQGELQFISFPWGASPDAPHEIVAKVQVVRCSGPSAVVILAADGEREAALTLYPDRLELHRLALTAPVQLDDRPHTVRLLLQGNNLEVFVDDQRLLDARGRFDYPAYEGRNAIGFGSLSSPGTGEAVWHRLSWRVQFPDVALHPGAEHFEVYREQDVYACFPALYELPDGALYATFGTRAKRSHLDNTGGTWSGPTGTSPWRARPAGATPRRRSGHPWRRKASRCARSGRARWPTPRVAGAQCGRRTAARSRTPRWRCPRTG